MTDIQKVREIANRLDELGAPIKVTDKIKHWANEEQKKQRNKSFKEESK